MNKARFLEAFVRKTEGVTRNENDGVGRYRLDASTGTLLSVRILHLLSIEDGIRLGIRQTVWVAHFRPKAVAWMLSRVGPTIRRGYRLYYIVRLLLLLLLLLLLSSHETVLSTQRQHYPKYPCLFFAVERYTLWSQKVKQKNNVSRQKP